MPSLRTGRWGRVKQVLLLWCIGQRPQFGRYLCDRWWRWYNDLRGRGEWPCANCDEDCPAEE